jgi:SAM-dependent methyltransferase
MDPIKVKSAVRERYARAARGESCCGADAGALGYEPGQLASVPAGTRGASLGCGSPVAAAALRAGERVLDLGSGAGLDVLLAAREVGPTGLVYGVDMTPEMVEKARAAAAAAGLTQVRVLEGEIEALPLPAGAVDVVLSNCVINLSPDKPGVFREAFRVLAPGGRFVVADMLATASLPADVAEDPDAWGACIAGALPEGDYVRGLGAAGFVAVEVRPVAGSEQGCGAAAGGSCCGGAAEDAPRVFSAIITARKPA